MENSCRFSAYVDDFVHGNLGQPELNTFEDHLTSCNVCKVELQAALRLKETITTSHSVNLDETFNYSVVNTLRSSEHFEQRKEIRLAIEDIVVSFATLLAIALLVIQMFKTPNVSSVDMVGKLTNIEKSSLEQQTLSNDQVLELVLRR